MKKTNKKGFTIVELVIVIAVIAILAAVLIPTFSGVVEKAKQSAALQKARNAYTESMALTNADLTKLGTTGYETTELVADTGVTSVAYSESTFTVVVDGYTYTYTAASGWTKTNP